MISIMKWSSLRVGPAIQLTQTEKMALTVDVSPKKKKWLNKLSMLYFFLELRNGPRWKNFKHIKQYLINHRNSQTFLSWNWLRIYWFHILNFSPFLSEISYNCHFVAILNKNYWRLHGMKPFSTKMLNIRGKGNKKVFRNSFRFYCPFILEPTI